MSQDWKFYSDHVYCPFIVPAQFSLVADLIDHGFVFDGNPRNIPRWMRATALREAGYRCGECGATERLEVDHVYPFVWGGPTALGNLQSLCGGCNARKKDRLPDCPHCGGLLSLVAESIGIRNGALVWRVSDTEVFCGPCEAFVSLRALSARRRLAEASCTG